MSLSALLIIGLVLLALLLLILFKIRLSWKNKNDPAFRRRQVEMEEEPGRLTEEQAKPPEEDEAERSRRDYEDSCGKGKAYWN